jgi:hypothetical protein
MKLLIVKQDEKQVKQRDERRHDADQHACRLPYHGKDFGSGVLYSLDHVLLLEEALYGLAVVTNPLLYGDGEVADVRLFVQVARKHLAELVKLLEHGRYYKVEYAADYSNDKQQRHYYRQHPRRHVQPVLHELDYRVNQVRQQPRHEERQQDAAEIVHQQQHDDHHHRGQRPTDELVESYLLFYYHSLMCYMVILPSGLTAA